MNVTARQVSSLASAKDAGTMLDRQNDLNPYLVEKGGAVHGRLFGGRWAAAKGFGDHSIVVGHPQSTLVHVHLLFQQSAWGREQKRRVRHSARGRLVTLRGRRAKTLDPGERAALGSVLAAALAPAAPTCSLRPATPPLRGAAGLSLGRVPPPSRWRQRSLPLRGLSRFSSLKQLLCPPYGHPFPRVVIYGR